MKIFWNSSIRQPGRIEGKSRVWTDDGMPLSYRVAYCHQSQGWTAHFEGYLVCRGTLSQCLASCEEADKTGIFADHPDMASTKGEYPVEHPLTEAEMSEPTPADTDNEEKKEGR